MEPFKETNIIKENCASIKENQIAYFPCLPAICNRGVYQTDAVINDAVCTKNYASYKNLTAEIFTVYCIHGIYLSTHYLFIHLFIHSTYLLG